MRKRMFVSGIALCLALSVAGCGKGSEEQQAANYYQNELGLDKEEAEDLAHELYGKDEEEPSATEAPKETVVEPLPELVNSEWFDYKVQVYDMVFNNNFYDGCMTEEEIRKIVEGSAYDVELTEGFDNNGDICLSGLMVDGKMVAQFWKTSLGNTAKYLVEDGLLDDGYYYRITYGDAYWGDKNSWYDIASVEFKDLNTRDDVLAYLAENGFVEVEREQAIYANAFEMAYPSMDTEIFSDDTPVEFADTPHYYSKGVQSITIFRMHKLCETDQVVGSRKYSTCYFSGAYVNLVNSVTFEFNTEGTIVSTSQSQYDLRFKIMGEQVQ